MRKPMVLLAVFLAQGGIATARVAEPPREAGEWARAFDRGDYPGAIALAKEELRARPRAIQAQIILARGEAALGRFDAAYEGFREALRIDPHSADALYYLGITAGVLAQGEYERLFALAPGSPRAHQLLGESYEAQSRSVEAETEYKAALEANPRSVELLVALGDLTRRNAQYDDAVAYYSRAAAIAPDSYDVLFGLGAAHAHQQEHAKAIEYLRLALRRDPSSASAHFALGSSLLQTGQTEAAVVELEAATRLEPRMRQAYYLLGRGYTALGRPQAGQAAFARFQELSKKGFDAGESGEVGSGAAEAPKPR
jgi:tetratricopeptide (TPR) repeat protein